MISTTCDLIIFDAQRTTDTDLVQMRLQIFIIEVEADIAIEITVIIIAGVAFDGAPDLLGRLTIAGQASDATAGRQHRSVDTKAWSRFGEQDRMGIREKKTQTGLFQQLF